MLGHKTPPPLSPSTEVIATWPVYTNPESQPPAKTLYLRLNTKGTACLVSADPPTPL
jgi:hypothetical protein